MEINKLVQLNNLRTAPELNKTKAKKAGLKILFSIPIKTE